MSKSKNDIAWEAIFEEYRILDRLAKNDRVISVPLKLGRS